MPQVLSTLLGCTACLCAGVEIAFPAGAFADDATPRVLFKDQPSGLGEQSVAWKSNYSGEVFSNFSGGLRTGTVYEGWAELGLGFNFEHLAGWKDTVFYVDAIYPHGDGLTNRYTGDLNVVSNLDANDSLRLYNCWMQTGFDENRLTVRLGMMAVDTDFFLSDGAAQFLNGAFGAFTVVSDDVTTSLYPVTAPAVRLAWKPNQAFTLRAEVLSGDLGTQSSDLHNTRWKLEGRDGVATFVEAALKWNTNGEGRPGTLKLGGFYDSKVFPALADSQSRHGNYGGYVIADQMVWREGPSGGAAKEGLDVFARVARAPEDRSFIADDFELGATYTGLVPGHDADVAGVGLVQAKVSQDARSPEGERFTSHRETVLEFFYLAVINDHFSVQPDFQYIFNPGAITGTRDAIVGGLRFNLTY